MRAVDIADDIRHAGWQTWAVFAAALLGVVLLVAGPPLAGVGAVLVLAAVAVVLLAFVRRVTRR